MKCPNCGAALEGLGKFCYACCSYVEAPRNAPAAQEGPAPTPEAPAAALAHPGTCSGADRQVLVLPLLSQNRAWSPVARVASLEKLREAVATGNWGKIKKCVFSQLHETHEMVEYKENVVAWAHAQHVRKMEGVLLRGLLTLYLPKWNHQLNCPLGDTDNYQKAMADALKGIAYDDDAVINEWHIARRYDKKDPRAVLILEADDGITCLDPTPGGTRFTYQLAF